jgi:ATP-dependent Zn protease
MRHDDEEGKMLYTKDELLKKIRTALGGRAAEIVYYGDREGISTGASGDLASATRLAKMMLCSCGMDEELGLAAFDASDMQSGALSLEMRKAVNRILDIEMKKAIRLIGENRASIDALVEKLLVENHLTGEEIKAVLEQARV